MQAAGIVEGGMFAFEELADDCAGSLDEIDLAGLEPTPLPEGPTVFGSPEDSQGPRWKRKLSSRSGPAASRVKREETDDDASFFGAAGFLGLADVSIEGPSLDFSLDEGATTAEAESSSDGSQSDPEASLSGGYCFRWQDALEREHTSAAVPANITTQALSHSTIPPGPSTFSSSATAGAASVTSVTSRSSRELRRRSSAGRGLRASAAATATACPAGTAVSTSAEGRGGRSSPSPAAHSRRPSPARWTRRVTQPKRSRRSSLPATGAGTATAAASAIAPPPPPAFSASVMGGAAMLPQACLDFAPESACDTAAGPRPFACDVRSAVASRDRVVVYAVSTRCCGRAHTVLRAFRDFVTLARRLSEALALLSPAAVAAAAGRPLAAAAVADGTAADNGVEFRPLPPTGPLPTVEFTPSALLDPAAVNRWLHGVLAMPGMPAQPSLRRFLEAEYLDGGAAAVGGGGCW